MKSCFKCGVLLLENEKTCPSCGTVLIRENKAEKEIAASEAVPLTDTISEQANTNLVPLSKRVIISPDPFLDSDYNKQYIMLTIFSLVPVLNLLLIPGLILSKKIKYGVKRRAKLIYLIVLIVTIILYFVITKYNIRTIFFNIKDFFRVIVKSFMGK